MEENIEEFFQMLSYMRPAFSETEEDFIKAFIDPLGVERDDFGNLFLEIGNSDVMWSSHTDTVHTKPGYQDIYLNSEDQDNVISLKNCLGADDTTGVWLMIEMIKANKPGLYIFHRAEEVGTKGSSFIAKNTPEKLKNINFAIALDRRGKDSFVTHQMGSRTASDAFGKSFIKQVPYLKLDDTGLYTDTYSYEHLIPECTNISVGYNNQHSQKEYQNIPYLIQIRDSLIGIDHKGFEVNRDPNDISNIKERYYNTKGYGDLYESYYNTPMTNENLMVDRVRNSLFQKQIEEKEDLEDFIKNNSELVADVLYSYYQIKVDDIIDCIHYN